MTAIRQWLAAMLRTWATAIDVPVVVPVPPEPVDVPPDVVPEPVVEPEPEAPEPVAPEPVDVPIEVEPPVEPPIDVPEPEPVEAPAVVAEPADVPSVESAEPDYLVLARVLTAEQTARWPERAGEAKRHQVYARLLKDFPDVPHRVLSRAIEDALEEE